MGVVNGIKGSAVQTDPAVPFRFNLLGLNLWDNVYHCLHHISPRNLDFSHPH